MTRFTFLVIYCYTAQYSSSSTCRAYFLCAFAQIAKNLLSSSSCLSPPVCMYYRGFHCTDFRQIRYLRLLRKFVYILHIWLKSDKKYRALCTNINYVHIVDSSTKYFAARRQCQGSPLLRFHGNTHWFYIVDNYMYLNSTKGMHVASCSEPRGI